MSAGEIARLIANHRYEFANEAELQEQIAGVLSRAGVQAEREVRLDSSSRLDFLAGSIAVEVKIGSSRPQLLSQIHRYAQDERISSIIVVSRKARHQSMPASLNGKDIHVASLMGSAF